MSTPKTNTEWIPQQIKVFSRWVSNHLSEGHSDIQVKDVTKDLSDGVALIKLAEILTHKEAPTHWAQDPKHISQMVTNCDIAIDMFEKDGVQFVGISGKDIHDSKQKLVLGLVWTLILRYSIGESISNDTETSQTITSTLTYENNNKDALMHWAIDRTENYPNVNSFKPYDLSMCALLDSYVPDKINYNSLRVDDKENNAKLATKVMNDLGIPVFLDSDDLQETTVDEKALLTQLSTAKVVLEKLPPPTHVSQHSNERIVSKSNQITESKQKQFNELNVQSRDVELTKEQNDENMREIEESMRRDQEENKNLPDKIVIDGLEFTNIRVREISLEPKIDEKESETESESESDDEVQPRNVEPEFVPHQVEGDNSEYSGRKFGLVMSLNENDYNNGEKVDLTQNQLLFGEVKQYALTMVKSKQQYLNPAGLKLTITEPNIENDVFQQFTFGLNEWNTVIDSVQQRGMVWDVADEFNSNPPSGTPFYLFPFHGRHNQHFVYKDGMIYAKQNGQVVTFVGGDDPLVMMPPSNELKARQTFTIQLL